jgi:hypothetical protein
MHNVFNKIAAGSELRSTDARELHERGFVVLPGPMSVGGMERVSGAYDSIVASASADYVHAGSTTTRVRDFVNRGDEFDALYVFAPLLEHAAASSAETSNSARCTRARCGRTLPRKCSTST